MSDPVLLQQRHDAVLLLTLNRPDKLNALDLALTDALVSAFDVAEADPTVRAVVVTGAGRAFCAGADLKEFRDSTDDKSAALASRRSSLFARLYKMIPGLSKPVVAAVNGLALGGGCALVVACDMAIATENATFGYPEIKLGVVPAGIMPPLVRQVGAKATFDLIGTGRTVDAAEALRLGLVNRMVADEAVVDEALAVAGLMAGYAPDAVAEIKRLAFQGIDLPLPHGSQ